MSETSRCTNSKRTGNQTEKGSNLTRRRRRRLCVLYSRFSRTSAASAILPGLCQLLCSAGLLSPCRVSGYPFRAVKRHHRKNPTAPAHFFPVTNCHRLSRVRCEPFTARRLSEPQAAHTRCSPVSLSMHSKLSSSLEEI